MRLRKVLLGACGMTMVACGPTGGMVPVGGGPEGSGAASRWAIRTTDVERRLRVVADDSMLGRQAGTMGSRKATAYLAREARRIGLEPAGEAGTYFQVVPLERRGPDPQTRLGGVTFQAGDLLPLTAPYFPFGVRFDVEDVEVVFGGWGELSPEEAVGRWVVLAASAARPPDLGEWSQRYDGAAGLAIATLETLHENARDYLASTHTGSPLPEDGARLPAFLITREAARELLGADPAALELGGVGPRRVTGRGGIRTEPVEAPARNVIAVLPGRDPELRDEYVVLGAHSDHVGVTPALDHDSVRAFNLVMRPEGLQTPVREPTAEEREQIVSLRKDLAQDGVRPDSIHNGADDDGSGTVALLELAEYFEANRPRRSLLFVWHTAEELGMVGSRYFTDHPTRPIGAMVAQLNIDMISRGMAGDLPAGGPDYLQLIGSRRLSTELGDLVEKVNHEGGHGFRFDYQYDAPGHPQNIYCRSDHAMYARFGVPVTFFSTGVHPEYHQVSDEVEYVDFDKLTRVTAFIADVAEAVANLDHRVIVDQTLPDPDAPCKQ